MTSDIQAVLDAASEVIAGYSEHESEFSVAFVQLGTMQDLENAVDAWRAAGGKTSDEIASTGAAITDELARRAGHIAALAARIATLELWIKSDPVVSSKPRARSVADPINEVSSRPCQTCWHPEWLHSGYATACCGQNDADTGGCNCKAFAPRKATT